MIRLQDGFHAASNAVLRLLFFPYSKVDFEIEIDSKLRREQDQWELQIRPTLVNRGSMTAEDISVEVSSTYGVRVEMLSSKHAGFSIWPVGTRGTSENEQRGVMLYYKNSLHPKMKLPLGSLDTRKIERLRSTVIATGEQREFPQFTRDLTLRFDVYARDAERTSIELTYGGEQMNDYLGFTIHDRASTIDLPPIVRFLPADEIENPSD